MNYTVKFFSLTLISWVLGISGFMLGSHFTGAGGTFLLALLMSGGIIIILPITYVVHLAICVGFYLPTLYGLNRFLGSSKTKILFPVVTSFLLIILFSLFALPLVYSKEVEFMTLRPFYVVFLTSGAAFGLGYIIIFGRHKGE